MTKFKGRLLIVAVLAIGTVVPAMAQNKEPIKIGFFAPFSGDYSIFGEGYARGIQVWKDTFGELTIDGRPVKIVKVDTRCSVPMGLAAYRREAEKFLAIIGPACSGVVKAVTPLARAAKQPFLYLGHGPSLSQGRGEGGYRFRMTQPGAKSLANFAEFILKKWKAEGKTKLAIMHDTSVTYSKAGEVIKAKAKELGIKLVAIETFSLGSTDLSGELLSVRQSGAQAVMMVSYSADLARLLEQMTELNMDIPVAGNGDLPYVLVDAEGAKKDNLTLPDNVYFYSDFVPGGPATKVQEFAKRFKAKFNQFPLDINYEGWLAMGVLAEALKVPGAGESSEKLRDAIQNLQYDLGGRTVSFADSGDQATHLTFIGKVVDGEVRLVEIIQAPAQ